MKQEIEFIKFNPTQNMTILVQTNHPAESYPHIASQLMSYEHVYAEQVGFIERSMQQGAVAHLQMAGGEFCGNACMALAAHIAAEAKLEQHDQMHVMLTASGTEQLIVCHVKKQASGYGCQVSMPIPEQIERRSITYEGMDLEIIIVRYQEFIHIVIEVEEFDETMKRRAQALARLLGLTMGDKLIGIMLYQSSSAELAPLIYVPQLDSLIWERGCGSGTASLGAYLAWSQQREISQYIQQPGGAIKVIAKWHGAEVESMTIEGTVDIVAQGRAFIDDPASALLQTHHM
ncbi:diaminopimelate epimerase [Paenibacillus tundrae]